MITMEVDSATTYFYRGLSTDTKPTNNVGNGSIFFEMDTGITYMFDKDNNLWRAI